jgi:hypothetical protein
MQLVMTLEIKHAHARLKLKVTSTEAAADWVRLLERFLNISAPDGMPLSGTKDTGRTSFECGYLD